MKNVNTSVFRIALFAFLFAAISVSAQKLPGIQKKSVLAPTDIKVDGKPLEWSSFEAYNKNTDIYYTIANDKDNLYLVIQATEPDVIDKILMGGITFKVKPVNEKEIPVTITYGKTKLHVGASLGDKLKNKKEMDETYLALLNKQVSEPKVIFIAGVKDFPDSVVSVYNEQDVHASASLGMNKAYTCEISIAFKYLPKTILDRQKFNYTIVLNGFEPNYSPSALANPNGIIARAAAQMAKDPVLMALSSPTDFSGSYTLAKK